MGWRWPLVFLVLGMFAWESAWTASPVGESPKTANLPFSGTSPLTLKQNIAPLLATYCTGCHGGAKPKAGLALDSYKDEAAVRRDREVWEKVAKRVQTGEMPPPRRPRPTPAEVQLLCRWVDSLDPAGLNGGKNPGRVTIRRLNRAEYNNTIRDLLGVQFRPADDFPADDVGYGFDNIGDVLSLSPILMEKYLSAAEKITELAFQDPQTRERILICRPGELTEAACARRVLENFARRAYRRPPTPQEVDHLASLVSLAKSQGDSFEGGIQLAVQATLVSPHFLFRVELDQGGSTIHPLGDYELASRLSYFLWSSMPDEELFNLAKQGVLTKEANLEGQVRRMLADPKARALVENFAGQWLQLRNLKTASPDPGRFPAFNDSLRRAMQTETEMFFADIVKQDRNILDFLDARFTFLNERLARHYGIEGIKGEEFRRVVLTGEQRGGVLTQASILTVTSNPTRTSPVKRGKWVLDNILGSPPPPPPPDVPELSEGKEAILSGPLRQRMEKHRANPACASCHQRMDPLGFGLENFDPIGAWRQRDGNFPIDASGTLPEGQSFKGPGDLRAVLRSKEADFRRCLAEKMFTYALGRGLEIYDQDAVDKLCREVGGHGNQFSSLVIAIVKSDPFRMRRGK